MGLIRLIEWILELVLNFRMAEKNLERAMSQHHAGPQVTMMQAFIRGDYQQALAISAAAQHGVNVGVFDGALLMQIGRLNEAERMISQALASETEPRSTALAHCCLGEVYLFQHQYDKALSCYNSALSLWPERGGTYRAIAELGLRRGEDPFVVLQWAHLAVEKEKASQGIVPMTKVANLSAELATLAWAVAASSRNAPEVDSLVAEADSFCAGIPVTSIAQAHVYCAMAYAALGNEAKSAQHFDAAARIDPNGAWGREAQQQAVAATVH
jgi:tetratricopeptide (TPR) repeat protein